MTQLEVARIVDSWCKRLALERWDISIDWESGVAGGDLAEMVWDDSYEKASLRFGAMWADWPVREVNQIVVHELLHLWTRNLELVVRDARSQLHPSAGEQIRLRFDHELEGLVDRLAYRFVEVGGVVDGAEPEGAAGFHGVWLNSTTASVRDVEHPGLQERPRAA